MSFMVISFTLTMIPRGIVSAKRINEVLDKASDIGRAALFGALTPDSGAMTVFNTLSWNRKADVLLPDGTSGATYADGRALPTQRLEDGVHALVDLPSCGTVTLTLNGGTVTVPAMDAVLVKI